MTSKTTALAIVVASLGLLTMQAAFAKPFPYYGPDALKKICLNKTNNGTFLPQTPLSPVYVCIGKGGMIICGGIGKWAKTCETGTLLTRREIRSTITARKHGLASG